MRCLCRLSPPSYESIRQRLGPLLLASFSSFFSSFCYAVINIRRSTNRRLAPCRSQKSENVISFEQYWALVGWGSRDIGNTLRIPLNGTSLAYYQVAMPSHLRNGCHSLRSARISHFQLCTIAVVKHVQGSYIHRGYKLGGLKNIEKSQTKCL